MALSYPHNLALGLTPNPFRMDLTYSQLSIVTRSPYSGQILAIRNPGVGFFKIKLAFPKMLIAQAAEWITVFNSLHGSFGSLYLPMYGRETIRGTGLGTPVIDGANQTGTTLNLRGFTVSELGVLVAGDLFNIGSDLYEVQRDVDSSVEGKGEVEIWPSLRSAPADGAAIITSNVSGVFRQDPEFEFNVDFNSASHYGFGWDGIEAV